MRIREIYEKTIRKGMDVDPRGRKAVEEDLKRLKEEFNGLKDKEKRKFDAERLANPYSDTRVLYGDLDREVKNILVGIDVEAAEVLLADRLRERSRPVDLIISHHPEGRAMANLYAVMGMQSDILLKYGGVPVNVAEDIMEERIKEVERKLLPINHNRAVDVARLLDMPLMCIHTPADNAVTDHLQRLFDEKSPRHVSDIIDILDDIPEYAYAAAETAGPKIVCGSGERKCGKVFVDMTGGTGGSKKAFEKLSQAGVGTVVGMHISEDHREEAEKNHINVVIAGHIASDTLGMNLLLDDVLTDVSVVETSGFKRVVRI